MKKISNENIRSIIAKAASQGIDVRIRDIAFEILFSSLDDSSLAYQCVFGTTPNESQSEYTLSARHAVLCDLLIRDGYIDAGSSREDGSVTFEENRREMEKLLKRTEAELENGTIEPKDAFKIIADIRVKLNDKFKVGEEASANTIIVNKKFNSICDHCHHEIYIPTKEDLMQQYGLVEKKQKK